MSEQFMVYYNPGHGWQPSNLGRFSSRAEAEAAVGPWVEGFARFGRSAPKVTVAPAGALAMVMTAEIVALKRCAEALRACVQEMEYREREKAAAFGLSLPAGQQALAALDAAQGEGEG